MKQKRSTLILAFLVLFLGCKKRHSNAIVIIPVPPTALTVTSVTNTTVNLLWTDESTNEGGFKIERKKIGENYFQVGTVGSNITHFEDQSLQPNIQYIYRVFSFNSAGNSLTYSNEVFVTTKGLPALTTSVIYDTTGISAISGGNITDDGGGSITSRGVVWSVNINPTVALTTKTIDGNSIGSFTSIMNNLTPGTQYFVRAYATNIYGTSYGNEIAFTTNAINIKSNLVAYYPFTGNSNDSSGNNFHGTVNGPILTTDRFGSQNAAYSFNHNNILIPHNSLLNFSNNFSISLWYLTSSSDMAQDLLIKGNDGTNYSWWVRHHGVTFNSPKTYFAYAYEGFFGNGYGSQVGAPTPPLNTWTHIACIMSGNTMKIYKNSALEESLSNINLTNSGSNISNLIVGSLQYSFTGKIDDIRIYNKTLSNAEIKYLFQH